MFNLDSLALQDTTTLQLTHPATEELLFDGEEVVGIELYGQASKQYRNAITALQNRALRRGNKQKATVEQLREESIGLLTACSARGVNLEYNGAPLDNADAFRTLYSDPKFAWIKDQVDAALGDVSRFLAQ